MQRSFQLLPIRIGLSLAPAAFTKKAAVILCLAFFPPWQRFPFSASDVVGKAFQNVPVSSSFKTSSGANPLVNSLTRSLQLSSVSWLTSPSSPAIFSRAILCLCFHFASQPSVPLNVSPSCSSIKRASSLRSGPSTGILAPLVFTCHSQRRSFTFSNFSLLFLLWLPVPFEVHSSRMMSFLARICAVWIFPHPDLFANCVALCASSLDAYIT